MEETKSLFALFLFAIMQEISPDGQSIISLAVLLALPQMNRGLFVYKVIIFVGIIATFGQALITAFGLVSDQPNILWNIFGYLLIIILLFALIVYMDGGERRIKVNYAKMVRGNKMYGGQSTYIPLKITSGGVMPIIFASAFMMFPTMIVSFLDPSSDLYMFYYTYLYATGTWSGNAWVGNIVYYLFMFIDPYYFNTDLTLAATFSAVNPNFSKRRF
jgi:preprotein translocase subunit SecY